MRVELGGDVEGGADFDVFLGKVVAVDEGFADLVGGVGILAVVGVVALFEKAGVAALDGRITVPVPEWPESIGLASSKTVPG